MMSICTSVTLHAPGYAPVLVKNKILTSKGEWRRLILGNAIHDLDKNESIIDQNIKVTENLTLKIGKKRFVRVLVK